MTKPSIYDDMMSPDQRRDLDRITDEIITTRAELVRLEVERLHEEIAAREDRLVKTKADRHREIAHEKQTDELRVILEVAGAARSLLCADIRRPFGSAGPGGA